MTFATLGNPRIEDLDSVCQQLSALCLADDVDPESEKWEKENPLLLKYYNALYIYGDICNNGLCNVGPVELFRETFGFNAEDLGWVPHYTIEDKENGEAPDGKFWQYEGNIPDPDFDRIAKATESKLREIIADAAKEQSITMPKER